MKCFAVIAFPTFRKPFDILCWRKIRQKSFGLERDCILWQTKIDRYSLEWDKESIGYLWTEVKTSVWYSLPIQIDYFNTDGNAALHLKFIHVLFYILEIANGRWDEFLKEIHIPYSRENKQCLFKTHAVLGCAYFRAFSKFILYFGQCQCIQGMFMAQIYL